ncbi:hypothetical protein ACRALDRAFT_1062031 [Sodiomyces alcalophilus JCM 7366]|uniref:uncharacterized protein n=1 Tax=Sodiomyces alcalophilus JCM 7366 TaxID=591952 RepID=UPI0039B3F2DC
MALSGHISIQYVKHGFVAHITAWSHVELSVIGSFIPRVLDHMDRVSRINPEMLITLGLPIFSLPC